LLLISGEKGVRSSYLEVLKGDIAAWGTRGRGRGRGGRFDEE
jgi:hypothetical protein